MRRDMDLVRKILLRIEEEKSGFVGRPLEIEGHEDDEVGIHCRIMWEAGLIDAIQAGSAQAIPLRLTWNGHEFLDAAREPARWDKAKSAIGKIAGATLPVWLEVLTTYAKAKLGLPE